MNVNLWDFVSHQGQAKETWPSKAKTAQKTYCNQSVINQIQSEDLLLDRDLEVQMVTTY